MKYLLLLLISFNALGAGWFPVGKEGAITVYVEQSACLEKEGQECFDIEFCPIDECILIDEVDDIGVYTGKKLLRHSPVRKAAKEAKEQDEKDAEIVKKEKRKADKAAIKEDIKNANTVAKLKALVEKMIEAQE